MTANNNQTETENQFKKGQEVWVKARICNDEIDRYGDLKINITYSHGNCLAHCLPSEIRTTEQIVQEHGASAPQTATDGTINLTLCLTEEEYKHLKRCVSWYVPCGEYEEKLDETIYNKLSNANTTEIPHFGEKIPQNAELTEQNAECWVRATCTETTDNGYLVVLADTLTDSIIAYVAPENVRFTEPDRTRSFKKGDKVQRRKELYGRPLNKWADEIPFDVIYEVLEDEDPLNNHNVKIEHNGESYFVNFVYFDLVEPAPKPRYWCQKEENGYYLINTKRSDGRIMIVKTMNAKFFTLEEAQEECEQLNRKEEDE